MQRTRINTHTSTKSSVSTSVKRPPSTLTVAQAARKFNLHPNTIRRLLRQGRLAGKKIASTGSGQWLVSAKATLPLQPPNGPESMSGHELKKIYASSSRLTANVDRSQIREMIRRGFFVKGVWLDELETLESVAKEIVHDRDKKGRTILQIDPEFWGRAKEIVDLGAKIRFKERYSEIR